jgi:hypothetical protein
VASLVESGAGSFGLPVTIVTEPGMKRDTFAASDAALAASGTVAVELAVVGTPAVIAYRANPISVAIARRMIKVKYASLVNLLLERAATPVPAGTAGRSWPRRSTGCSAIRWPARRSRPPIQEAMPSSPSTACRVTAPPRSRSR